MTDPLTTELVALEELQADPLNPRTMPAHEAAALRRSLAEFGCVEPVVARRSDRLVIAGHQRLEAARQLGWSHIPVVWWEGSDRAARALNLALNRIHGEWDATRLAAVLAQLADVESLSEALAGFDPTWTELAGFGIKEVLAALDGQLAEAGAGRGEDLANLARKLVAAPGREAAVGPGEGYQLGAHRVLCGDATDLDTVRRLCGDGPPDLLLSDPPYGVAYVPEAAPGRAGSSGRTTGRRARPLGAIAGDALPPADYAALVGSALANAAAVLAPGAGVYLCGGTGTTCVYDQAFAAAGLVKSSTIVWDKGEFSFGRKDYQSQYETLTYGWRRGGPHRFFGGRAQTDIWPIPRDAGTCYLHPTQKPVALFLRAIANSTLAGDTVLDLFGGSGTTLIAAEQAGRRALLLELDPHYVGVMVARWEALTGRTATPLAPEAVDA